jgi:hypothetical protein
MPPFEARYARTSRVSANALIRGDARSLWGVLTHTRCIVTDTLGPFLMVW